MTEEAVAVAPEVDYPAVIAELVHDDQLERAVAVASELHPAELANVLAGVDNDARQLLVTRLDPGKIGAALGYLEPHFRDDLLVSLDAEHIAAIIRTTEDDVATDIVQELPRELREAVLRAVPRRLQRHVGDLLKHEEDTAGGVMTAQRVAVPPDATVAWVIDYLRTLRPDTARPFYVYVVGTDERLEGVLNLRSLITSPPETPILDVALTDVVTVTPDTDQEEAARTLKRYKLLSLPVVDEGGRLLGTITADDLLDVLEDEATEDMFRMAGVDEEEDLRSVIRSVRFRLPWLQVNLLTALLAAFTVAMFQDTLTRAAVIAAFLPVVAGMGGNAGIQTLTVVVRSLALGRLSGRNTRTVLVHEVAVGLLMGAATGILLSIVTLLWQGNPTLGVVVGLALVGNVVVGTVAGLLIPMGLRWLGQDPALSGGIWLTTCTDVCGFLIYLGLATALISRIE